MSMSMYIDVLSNTKNVQVQYNILVVKIKVLVFSLLTDSFSITGDKSWGCHCSRW